MKLFETRQGRCGEWANAFCVVCRAMGFETRYVVDWTDHVWTEVWHEQQQRWIHCDGCEGPQALDTPLMYEQGWGKKLCFVLAFGDQEIVDVTPRYVRDPSVAQRRLMISEYWLSETLFTMSNWLQRNASKARKEELAKRQEHAYQVFSQGPLLPRQSGALCWRVARGEMG